ncbi:ureidoglycolate hydrolase, putative [Talaromyces stipitatus ATCC 10500]|uniref:Ureidoglycolate hydrolase, putative n=1 Tax=Talaromyces stipitatus (strain ATCC 10500 / CBS 375.48 / QM 6759 / NRRL 1006) TaxID=441959 RepID=B8MF66_TALSN|nr:ureidoglycolate hydrolase, putative [Talaromyces stipitatus ATCC 10500]EED16165.1 ureidoglycolate hydrolase, putative [Talaromyces stipitatus ATCC 10500]
MAPTLVSSPPTLRINPEPLTPQSFAPFGTVITTPFPRDLLGAPNNLPSLKLPHRVPATPVYANQGSAVKISPIAPLANGYENVCPSGKAAQARLSMFACFPRKLRRERQSAHRLVEHSLKHININEQQDEDNDFEGPVFDVRILERHPYTTQTFIPLDLSSQRRVLRDRVPDKKSHDWKGYGEGDVSITLDGSAEQDEEQEEPMFLVIVAPTLKGQSAAATTLSSSDSTNSSSSSIATLSDPVNEGSADSNRVLIRDPPDLENLRAFIARGGQAVTYGPVLGPRRIDFVVVQYVNGVDDEDCQEAAFKDGIVVDVKSLTEEEDELWNDLKKLSKL